FYLFRHRLASLRHLLSFPTRRSSDLHSLAVGPYPAVYRVTESGDLQHLVEVCIVGGSPGTGPVQPEVVHSGHVGQESGALHECADRKSTRLNSSHVSISYAVLCLKKK